MGTPRAIQITLFLIGLLLSEMAIAKLWMLVTDPFADIRVGLPKSILWISVAFDFALAWINFSAKDHRLLILVNLAVFAAFAVFSSIRWMLGYSSCGCSGSLELPIWYFVMLDIGLVIWLLFVGHRHGLLDNGPSHLASVWRSLSPMRRGQVAGVGLFLVVMLAIQFPIAAPLRSVVLGEPKIQATVSVTDPLKVGEECSGEVELHNTSSFPARIIGISHSCRCFDFRDDPTTVVLPAHSRISRALIIKPRESGPLRERIELFLDHPEQFRVAVNFVGMSKGD